MKQVVKLQGVSKVYGQDQTAFHALKDINIDINEGEFVAIIGPSGSGKSTLMNIIGLLDRPSAGYYFLDGEDISKFSEEKQANLRNKKIGFVFQSFNLLARTTSLDNVALPLIYAGLSLVSRIEKAKQALEKVGLLDKLNSKPNQLSGGQQQRVAIARALVTNPQMILADEPTGNLDTQTGNEIMKLFQDLHQEGKTIVVITHEANIAKMAKRVIKIRDGKIDN